MLPGRLDAQARSERLPVLVGPRSRTLPPRGQHARIGPKEGCRFCRPSVQHCWESQLARRFFGLSRTDRLGSCGSLNLYVVSPATARARELRGTRACLLLPLAIRPPSETARAVQTLWRPESGRHWFRAYRDIGVLPFDIALELGARHDTVAVDVHIVEARAEIEITG